MDVGAPDLDDLSDALKTKIPEFFSTRDFPIKSPQPETTAGPRAHRAGGSALKPRAIHARYAS